MLWFIQVYKSRSYDNILVQKGKISVIFLIDDHSQASGGTKVGGWAHIRGPGLKSPPRAFIEGGAFVKGDSVIIFIQLSITFMTCSISNFLGVHFWFRDLENFHNTLTVKNQIMTEWASLIVLIKCLYNFWF